MLGSQVFIGHQRKLKASNQAGKKEKYLDFNELLALGEMEKQSISVYSNAIKLDPRTKTDVVWRRKKTILVTTRIMQACFLRARTQMSRAAIPTSGRSSVLTRTMSLDVGENLLDYVITFIDISQLDDVRYGFVHFHGSAVKTPTPAKMAMSVCANTYLWAYYDENVEGKKGLKFNLFLSKFKDKKVAKLLNSSLCGGMKMLNKKTEEQDLIRRGIKILKTTVMNMTIKMALKKHDPDMGLLLHAELVPSFLDSLKNTLYEQADTLVPTRCT